VKINNIQEIVKLKVFFANNFWSGWFLNNDLREEIILSILSAFFCKKKISMIK